MRQVAGFPCPECGQDELADIVMMDAELLYELELSCPKCARVWTAGLT